MTAPTTTMRCLYGTDCPPKLQCCFTHPEEELCIFEEYDHLGDYILKYTQDRPCKATMCSNAGKCVCNDMEHPYFKAEYTDDPLAAYPGINECLSSDCHSMGPCLCPKCASAKENSSPSSSIDDHSDHSSSEDSYFDHDFKTDDDQWHRAADLPDVGYGFSETSDMQGYSYYVNRGTLESTYLHPGRWDWDDDTLDESHPDEEHLKGDVPPRIVNYPD